jgi:CheY-like chemotaxis protein
MKPATRILIIDDDPHVREFLRAFLELSGHAVIEAENGAHGCDQATLHKPHLIICDGNMPVMDGLTALRRLRALPAVAGTPFIFLTASDCEHRRREAVDLGANAYLLKPVDLALLLETIDRTLVQTATN